MAIRQWLPLLTLLLIVPFLLSLQPAADDSKPTWDENVPPLPKVTASRDSCEAFARWIESEVNAGRVDVLTRVILDTAIICRAGTGLKDSAVLVRRGLEGMPWSRGFAREMGEAYEGGVRWKLIDFDWNDGVPTAVYRISSMRFVDYIRLWLAMDATGHLRVGDHENVLGSYRQSVGIRRMFTWRGTSSAASASSERQPAFMDVCDSMFAQDADDDPCRAVEYWYSLPDEIRFDLRIFGHFLSSSFHCSSEANDTAYRYGVERFDDEPALNGAMYQNDMAYGRYESALRRIRRSDSMVGGDPYLDLVRADVSLLLGHAITARTYVLGYLKSDTTIAYPYWLLLQASLKQRKFDETAGMLEVLRTRFDVPVNPDSVRATEPFAEFVTSREFAAWERNVAEWERRERERTTIDAADPARRSDERSQEADDRPE